MVISLTGETVNIPDASLDSRVSKAEVASQNVAMQPMATLTSTSVLTQSPTSFSNGNGKRGNALSANGVPIGANGETNGANGISNGGSGVSHSRIGRNGGANGDSGVPNGASIRGNHHDFVAK